MSLSDWIDTLVKVASGSAATGALVALVQAFRKPSSKAEQTDAETRASETLYRALETRVVALEGENERCRAENRKLWEALMGLELQLRAKGIDVPALANSIVAIEVDRTTILKPDRSLE